MLGILIFLLRSSIFLLGILTWLCFPLARSVSLHFALLRSVLFYLASRAKGKYPHPPFLLLARRAAVNNDRLTACDFTAMKAVI